MHNYLKAIGFGNIDKDELDKIIEDVINNADRTSNAICSENTKLVEFIKSFGKGFGIAVCGEYIQDDKFRIEYYYPYFIGSGVTTDEKVDVKKHSDKESYAGICDDVKVGITIIFYLQNITEYLNVKYIGHAFKGDMNVTLSALSIDGKIILPVNKTPVQVNNHKEYTKQRSSLIAAAREGDEDAIENLTLEDMDMYAMLSRRVVTEDVLSIVDTSFMPYGIESDQYAIIAQILDFRLENNKVTQNEVYILTVDCNDLIFDVCIAKDNLLGEPAVGRRFKGSIWMQGRINYDYSI